MKTIVLDSLPTVPIRIPDEVQFNVSPFYSGKKTKGQPLLGQQQVKYTRFVPMGDAAPSIKKLLELPETDTAPLKPIEGYEEIDKEEKEKFNTQGETTTPAKVFDSKFINEAQDYLNKPNTDKIDSYFPNEETPPVVEKNSANLANIVSVTQTQPSRRRPKTTMSSKSKSKSKSTAKTKNKSNSKKTTKRMTTFKILPKNK